MISHIITYYRSEMDTFLA